MKKLFYNPCLRHSVLVLVDIQNDFLQLGALPVPKGDEIIPLVNELQNYFEDIVATKDWHPDDHVSFLSDTNNKGWPKHCVKNTWGSQFSKDLDITKIKAVFFKGQDKNYDSYSGFYDDFNKNKPSGLLDYLHSNLIDTVFVVGLALDFCVKETIIDAYNLRFKSYLITDAIRSISPFPESIILELQKIGILTCLSQDIFYNFKVVDI